MAAQQHMLKQMIEQATHAHIAQEEAKVRMIPPPPCSYFFFSTHCTPTYPPFIFRKK